MSSTISSPDTRSGSIGARVDTSTSSGSAAASTAVVRSSGWAGSSGTYPAPAVSTAYMATSSSVLRGIASATSDSGPTPRPISTRASRLTAAANSP
ncbi:Uncharacterised protein [Mycobacteroides abscessus subsp. abscessus]|nr:Uncharacterised protein [Mycobacteroides abscessus subsp. abscessus]